ncbi:MAG: S8 family peptidase [Lachnospiraceae bacterium]|nr:S8 family peptidase [Lachnospiraceae bacterium]
MKTEPSFLSASQAETVTDSRERILSEDYVSLIYRYLTSIQQLELTLPNFLPQAASGHYAILNAPLKDFPPDITALGYFTIPKLLTLQDTLSLEASGILQVQTQPFLNLKGKGTLIGFIDTGITYTHPAFRNPDGTTRILGIWDQTIQSGTPPLGFLYGSEYSKEQIDQALLSVDSTDIVPSVDENGHGTALAGIAAGGVNEGAHFSGAAPQASLLVVKLKPAKKYLREFYLIEEDAVAFQEDDCMLAIRYLYQKARSLQMPLVICFGLGTNQGGHDGKAPLDDMISSITTAPGNYAITAAGNEAGKGHHYFGKMNRSGDSADVEVLIDGDTKGFTMELWAFAPDLFALGVTSPLGETIQPVEPRPGASQNTSFLLEPSSISIYYEIIELRSGSQLILVRLVNPSPGVWRFRILNKRYLTGIYHIWLPITGFIAPFVRFLNPDPDTTLVAPSNNEEVITVSTYQTFNNSLYLNSSRGFTRDDHIKPDIAAPGVNVLAPDLKFGYRTFTGSSAASALTAGAVSLLVQWSLEKGMGKLLSSEEIKNLLYRGAVRSDLLYYPNKEWGYGMLNIYGIFESLLGF